MFVIKQKSSIKAAKPWFDLVQGGGYSYQSYEVLRACERIQVIKNMFSAIIHPLRAIRRAVKFQRCHHRVYSVWCGDRLLLIAPLFVKEAKSWAVAGEAYNLDYQDFVYDSESSIEMKGQAFDALMSSLKNDGITSVEIGQLDTSSCTQVFAEVYSCKEIGESKSVCINLSRGSHEEYFAELNKHTKQNVRTAYNRLRRDNHVIEHVFYSAVGLGEDIRTDKGLSDLRSCRKVYRCRQEARYKHYGLKYRFILSKANYTTLSVPGGIGFVSLVKIDGKIGAFMEGYVNEQRGALEIPRLAIDDEFGWYSPGLVLVNETAKFLYAETGIRHIDLCRGTEKYKTDMGGEIYLTKRVVFNTEKLR